MSYTRNLFRGSRTQKQIFSAFVSGYNHAQIYTINTRPRSRPSIILETNIDLGTRLSNQFVHCTCVFTIFSGDVQTQDSLATYCAFVVNCSYTLSGEKKIIR